MPVGFVLSTRAYKNFVEANDLHGTILDIVADATPHEAASSERASASIQSVFEAARLPADIAASVAHAYGSLGEDGPAVAVPSSATADDLPDVSFAGQQDTYWYVRGEAPLLDAIRKCWASPWTARAIGYRMQMGVDQRGRTMAVIVQVMVARGCVRHPVYSNPSTGDRPELVVNASLGLGAAIVWGRPSREQS